MNNFTQDEKPKVFAAIDLGTNNCRLMLAKESFTGKNNFTVVDTFSKITRLGEGMVSNRLLSEKAMERTLKVLDRLAGKLHLYDVQDSRFIATEACRKACNAQAFMDEVLTKTGLEFEIISSDEEARLAITGCLPLMKKNIRDILVFDIGGGSSEIALAQRDENGNVAVKGNISIPIGVLTVSEGFTGTDISGKAKETIFAKVNAAMAKFNDDFHISDKLKTDKIQMIGTSGTVTSLGAFYLGLNRYNRSLVDGLVISAADVRKTGEKLEGMTNLERITHPCIGPQRADLTLAGCAILSAIFNFWDIDKLTIADRGLREGILVDLINKKRASKAK